jgi:hypothetical protein
LFPKLQSLPNARFRLTVLHFSRVLLSSTSLVCGDSCQSPAQFEPYTSSTDLQQERSIIDQKTELATETDTETEEERTMIAVAGIVPAVAITAAHLPTVTAAAVACGR